MRQHKNINAGMIIHRGRKYEIEFTNTEMTDVVTFKLIAYDGDEVSQQIHEEIMHAYATNIYNRWSDIMNDTYNNREI